MPGLGDAGASPLMAIPLGALLVGGFLLVGACIWGLLGLLIMKEISLLEFILYTAVLLTLSLIAPVTGGRLGLMSSALIVPLAIGFPLARRWSAARALARLEQQDITKYVASIRKRPEIPYPYRRLAEIYARRGNYDVAADLYEQYQALTHEPEIAHRIKRCVELLERARQRIRICTECLHENTAEARYCSGCGAVMPGPWEILTLFRGRAGLKYLLLVSVVSLLVGVLVGFLTTLNTVYAILFLWIAATGFFYYLYKRVTMY